MRLDYVDGLVFVTLSRRNLLSLLAKLDGHPPGSSCTLGKGSVWVRAEEDAAHYGSRTPGPMHPETEEEIK